MRFRNILPVILAMAALSSCSVYRSGQTPDDVYYSPGRAEDDSYLTVDNDRKGRSYGRYDNDNTNPDDNYLRMRVRDRNRWSSFDNYAYMNDWQYNGGYYGMYSPYAYNNFGYGGYGYGGYGYGMGMGFGPYGYYNPWSFNSYWNSYYAWNSYYNPYCPGIIVGSYKTNPVVYNSVRNASSLSSYNNRSYNNRNSSGGGRPIYQSNNARYNNSNGSYYTNPNSSGGLRRAYPSSSSNNGGYSPSYQPSSSSSAPVRSYSPSSSGSSGGGGSRGGSSGGGGGVSRPSRGG